MGSLSIWHWLVVAAVFLLLFGRSRISEMMGDLAKGIKAFKKGLNEEDPPTSNEKAAPLAQKPNIPQAADKES